MASADTLLADACDSKIACLTNRDLWVAIAQTLASNAGMTAEELLAAACDSKIACLQSRDLLIVTAELLSGSPTSCSITTTSLPDGTVGVAYSQTVQSSAPGSSFTVTAGTLPNGLTLSSGGTISGTPTVAATFDFTVQASTPGGVTCSRALSIKIAAAGFSPPNAVDLTLWLKPESLSGLANNDPIDTWPDSSGNANNFIAENTSFRPLYKTNQIGGQPAAVFDGVDDFLKIASALGVVDSWSLFVVLQFDAAVPATGREWIFKNGEGTGAGAAKWDGNRNGFFLNGTFLNDGACTTAAEAWLWNRDAGGPVAALYVNNVNTGVTNSTAAMGAGPDPTSRLGIFLNATFPFKGKIAEVMLWKSSLPGASKNQVFTYLTAKYSL